MNKLLKAHWNCHGVCNCHCKFCYGMFRGHPALSTPDAQALIGKLAGRVTEFVFGGGDPLLRKDLSGLIEFASDAGLVVEVQTNAHTLTRSFIARHRERITRWGLSMDSWDAQLHDSVRGRVGNHAKVLEAASVFSQYGLNWNLRSLVSKPTLSGLAPIGEWLAATRFTGTWYLLQYAPLGDEKHNCDTFQISDADFLAAVKPIEARFSKAPFRVIAVPDVDRRQIYFLIAPDGAVYNHPPPGRPYSVVGNILTESFDILLDRLDIDFRAHYLRYGSADEPVDFADSMAPTAHADTLIQVQPVSPQDSPEVFDTITHSRSASSEFNPRPTS